MKLSITITDQRIKASTFGATYYSSDKQETEEYQRVRISDMDANGKVTADTLRAIANEIDPPRTQSGPVISQEFGGIR